MARKRDIDSVRASRDGHEFHEAWTARRAMQLLWPDSELTAIAIEGPSPADQANASAATIEVADVALYFGGDPTFESAKRTTFAQFKYSIANQDKNFRAADAKKTVRKFGLTYRSYRGKYGAEAVEQKLDFQLITNQPISDALRQAIDAIATGTSCVGDAKNQLVQLKTASGLTGKALAGFAKKLKILGRSGSLPTNKNELASLLVDWSVSGTDPIASSRLGRLRELVREKAGYAGTGKNVIARTDILAVLQIGDSKELLPCEPVLVDVGKVLEREQLAEAIAIVRRMSNPLLVHAAGGVGKTVFMDTLAHRIAADHEVVFFDCFGGGAYRSPEDARHLPKRGLVHIANTLAFRGMCDPMLPGSPDLPTILSTFRRRLVQCVATMARVTPVRHLALFIDAIDNAGFAAGQRSEDSFPIKLLESLDTEPIAGVKLIVSCRTERRPKTYAKYEELPLRPFNKDETSWFLRARLKDVSQTEINVAQARSGGNPRVLDYLLKSERGLLDQSEINNEIELDDLIQQRITDALGAALARGTEEKDVNAFLAGLAVLPPPVPLDEYAGAHRIDISAIESFASDLSPLLERTSHGLMFRDEPTETLVQKRYASSHEALQIVAVNLHARQETSVYAARSLPGLLHELDDSEQLFALAFDERIPASITSTVGKRNVQYARLKAATLHAAVKKDYNKLVRLLLELSTIAAVDQRGADYILDHPDLVVAAEDVDARRRLFEIRTGWPGTRHTRLAIAHTLSGEFEEAYRHARFGSEWIEHYRRTDHSMRPSDPGPEHEDIAAIPLFLLSQGRGGDAAVYLERWREWYAYEVCEYIFASAHVAQSIRGESPRRLGKFINSLTGIGPLAAALSFAQLPRAKRKDLTGKLATLCKSKNKPDLPGHHPKRRTYELEDGLRKASVAALTAGRGGEALAIARSARNDRPGIWTFRDGFSHADVLGLIFRAALVAAAKKTLVHEKDVLPRELVRICSSISKQLTGNAFRDKAQQKLSDSPRKPRNDDGSSNDPNAMSHEEYQAAEKFLRSRLQPLLGLTAALSTALGASARSVDERFGELVDAWKQARNSTDEYNAQSNDHFFDVLGLEAVLLVLWSRPELKPAAVEHFLGDINAHYVGARVLVRVVALLAQRTRLQALAGKLAIRASAAIEKEDEVNSRASLYGALGRAMLPASRDEASVYFRNGLEQMDAIGSGDYQFTNELLLFASEVKGQELDERDFHTLTNICELNLGEEPEKFFWGAFGRGLAKVSGLRGLAKLSRWDDRGKIALDNTLLPYLTGLLESRKIDPKDALALNRLASPVEYYFASTKEFAEALRKHGGPDPVTIAELINQFEGDNPDIAADSTVEALCTLAQEALGAEHEITERLAATRDRYTARREGRNSRYNPANGAGKVGKEVAKSDELNRKALARIAAATDPLDEASLVKAIAAFNALGNLYDLKDYFFSALRAKVPYARRGEYIRNVAALEDLYFYWQFAELKDTKAAWGGSSAALADIYKGLAHPIILAHAEDLVDDGRLSGSSIKEISEFTGVSTAELALEVIKVFSRPDSAVAGSVWLAFASFIAPEASEGQGQLGLKRLLSSGTARFADRVDDGTWSAGRYPPSDIGEIAAGLIWRVLGSPHAVDRWRAAHSLRSFARFGRWDVIDRVVSHIPSSKTAGAFQAPELTFYYLHARLWLLIALARMALDHPEEIASYKDELLAVVTEKDAPHVLMQDFAAQALLTCVSSGRLALPVETSTFLSGVTRSAYPRLRKKIRTGGDFYHGRPKGVPKPPFEFHLDYDFHKHDVDNLSHVFGCGCWEVADMMSGIVHKLDPEVTTMYSDGGRTSRERTPHGIVSRFHSYGQQLGWHALFFAAGKLLTAGPVTDDWWYEDDPWGEWIGRYGLTRKDGLWLSDGTDRTPCDTALNLLESRKKGLAVTGAQDKLLQLAGLQGSRVVEYLTLEARWFSADNVRIKITSALVPTAKASFCARALTREDPMIAWLPVFQDSEGDDEYQWGGRAEYAPWVVCPSGETRLDEDDPYGVQVANLRPRLARSYAALCKLASRDPFGRNWHDDGGTASLTVQAWGRDEGDREDGPYPGTRLLCRSSIVKRILTACDKDLLVLINLQRYEKHYRGEGTYTNSVGVARIDKSLGVEYFKGHVNHVHKPRY